MRSLDYLHVAVTAKVGRVGNAVTSKSSEGGGATQSPKNLALMK